MIRIHPLGLVEGDGVDSAEFKPEEQAARGGVRAVGADGEGAGCGGGVDEVRGYGGAVGGVGDADQFLAVADVEVGEMRVRRALRHRSALKRYL